MTDPRGKIDWPCRDSRSRRTRPMRGKVIQGFFIGRPRPPVRPAQAFGTPTVAQARGTGGTFQVDAGQLGLGSGGGRPLPDAVRSKMEAALGADFSGVRVHVGPQAERIGAIAFAMGSDLYFAPGRYQPDTIQGQQLLGHELAHVVQQRQGRVRNPAGTGVAVVQDQALEAEADRLGQRAATYRMPAQPRTAPGTAQRSAVPAPGGNGASPAPPHHPRKADAGTVQGWRYETVRQSRMPRPGAGGAAPTGARPTRAGPWQGPVAQRQVRTQGRTIQMEDITINVPGFQKWTRDVDSVDLEQDILLFKQKVRADNSSLVSVQIWQNAGKGGEHQYVVVELEDGKLIQMDLAARGHSIWVHAGDPADHNLRAASDRRATKRGLKLYNLFAQFRAEANRAYNMETNDCTQFARRMYNWAAEPVSSSDSKSQADEDDFM
jgi:Domain of unknown function (DUF4157)